MVTWSRPPLITRIWSRDASVAVRAWSEAWQYPFFTLASQDTVYGAQGQVATYQPPLSPAGPRGTITNLTIALGLLQQPFGKDILEEAQGQVPTYEASNPTLRRALPSRDQLTWTQNVDIYLIGQDQVYGGPGFPPSYEYPNPQLPRYSYDLRGFLNASEIQLIGLDKQFGGPGEVISYDWPLPVRARTSLVAYDTIIINLQENTLFPAAVIGPALIARDFPNPIGYRYRYPIVVWSWLQNTDLMLIGQDKMYGAAGQTNPQLWTVPRGYQFPMANLGFVLPAVQIDEGLQPDLTNWHWIGVPLNSLGVS